MEPTRLDLVTGRTLATNLLRIPVTDAEEVTAYSYLLDHFRVDQNDDYTNRVDATMAGILAEDVILRWSVHLGADIELRRRDKTIADFRIGRCPKVELKTNYNKRDCVWEDWSLIIRDTHADKSDALMFAVYCAGSRMLHVLGACTPADFRERATYVPHGHLFPNGSVCNGPSSLVVQGFRWLTPYRRFLEEQGAL